ncbi:MAG TPA: AAA family ATPase, partial [Promineifilum sp.]|nr:AAA family ATPase [Promineifilum sp.]
AGLASPLVGRDRELGQLTAALDELRAGRGSIVSIIGEAGLGKSRLVAEALQSVTDGAVRCLEGKSQSYETATPYAPFVGILARSANLTPESTDAEQYAQLRAAVERLLPGRGEEMTPFLAQPLGLPVAAEEEERVRFLDPPILRGRVFEAIVVWIAALAAERPTVVYLDDVHWIDPTSLELLSMLLPIIERAPLLILLAFRPRPEDPSWRFHETTLQALAGRYVTIPLSPLDKNQGRVLVGNLLTIEDLPESVRQLILDKAEGNPFFLEEIIRSLLDVGLVERQDGHWRATADIVRLRIPDTLVGVITARQDRLDDADRQVIQAAAVLGRAFDYDALADLLGDAPRLDDSLSTLRRRELIRPAGEGRDSFKHGLTQEAAYESLLLSRRRQLHHLAAEALLRRTPDRAAEIARHFMAARQTAQALPYLVAAGHQAARAFAATEAVDYYSQALAHEELGDTATIRAAYEGLGGIHMMSDPAAALATYERMQAAAEARGDISMIISALNKAGSVLALMMGRFDEAANFLDRAERLTQEIED